MRFHKQNAQLQAPTPTPGLGESDALSIDPASSTGERDLAENPTLKQLNGFAESGMPEQIA